MSDLSTLYAINRARRNPARDRANMTANSINAMPNDRFGFSSIAKIPSMVMYGQQAGEAAQIDQQRDNDIMTLIDQQAKNEEDKVDFKRKYDVMTKIMEYVNSGDTGSAVQMANMFKDQLGLSPDVDVTSLIPSDTQGVGKGFHVELTNRKDGGKAIIGWNKNGKIFMNQGGQMVPASEEFLATIGTPAKKDNGFTLSPGQTRYDKSGKEIVSRPASEGAAGLKVGQTKEKLLSKIAQSGMNSLTDNEKQALNMLSEEDKTIANETLKMLRESMSYKAFNDENDPDGSKREAVVKTTEEMVRNLYNIKPDNEGASFEGEDPSQQMSVGQPDFTPTAPIDRSQYMNENEIGNDIMQNARQAPDGNWYIPDQKRPGKYLKVEPE